MLQPRYEGVMGNADCDLVMGEWWAIRVVTSLWGSTEGGIDYDLVMWLLGDPLRGTDETKWLVFKKK